MFKPAHLLVGLGTVGVGGATAATLYTFGGGGSGETSNGGGVSLSEKPPLTEGQIIAPAQSPAAAPSAGTAAPSGAEPSSSDGWSIPTAKDMDPKGAPDWTSLDKTKNLFNLYPSKCTLSFFPDAKENLRSRLDSESRENKEVSSPASQKVKTPKAFGGGAPKGCTMMQLKSKGADFLFRSEVAVRNDREGMSLLTGAKNIESPSGGIKVAVARYLLFFEKSGSKWTIIGGYSWGGVSKPLYVKSITIQSPDKTTINKTFNGTSADGSGETSDFYGGFWEAVSSGGSTLFNGPKPKSIEYSGGTQTTTISPLDLSGYGGVDAVYGTQDKKWFQLQTKPNGGDSTNATFDATSSVHGWNTIFNAKNGTWKTIKEHCEANKNIVDTSQKKESPCYSSAV